VIDPAPPRLSRASAAAICAGVVVGLLVAERRRRRHVIRALEREALAGALRLVGEQHELLTLYERAMGQLAADRALAGENDALGARESACGQVPRVPGPPDSSPPTSTTYVEPE
jgi:hypothetical protein